MGPLSLVGQKTTLTIQMVESTTKNFVVVDAKNYKEGDQLEDESNGFTYPHAASEMKYTATYDSARGDG